MSPVFYQVLHVFSVLVLGAFTAAACANPDPAKRRQTMIVTGIASLLILVSGVGLLHKMAYGWPVWAFVKIAVWLALSALAGMAYRLPGKGGALRLVVLALSFVAVLTVYTKLSFLN